MKRKPVTLTGKFATSKDVAKVHGVSKTRLKRIRKIMKTGGKRGTHN